MKFDAHVSIYCMQGKCTLHQHHKKRPK